MLNNVSFTEGSSNLSASRRASSARRRQCAGPLGAVMGELTVSRGRKFRGLWNAAELTERSHETGHNRPQDVTFHGLRARRCMARKALIRGCDEEHRPLHVWIIEMRGDGTCFSGKYPPAFFIL